MPPLLNPTPEPKKDWIVAGTPTLSSVTKELGERFLRVIVEECKACGGSGKNSNGGPCLPCIRNGKVKQELTDGDAS